jgi:transcriptional regulator with XRE-family HTH domain
MSIFKDIKSLSDHFSGRYMPTRPATALPLPVQRALRKLGRDIRDARIRRRIPTTVMAERASISRTTLNKAEKGDPGVSLGTYATILFVLGLSERLGELADIRSDKVGLELEDETLPQRIRHRKRSDLPPPPAKRQ